MDVQFALEERGVKQWAAERFEAVATVAAAGDELYKNREYEAATARYQEALAALQALRDGIPEELAGQLDQARQAIEDGEQTTANTTLELAAVIEPDSPELATLRQRADALPRLLPLLEQAAEAEQNGDLAGADREIDTVLAGDPGDVDALVIEAAIMVRRGHADDAIRQLETLTTQRGDHVAGHYWLGEALMALQRYEQAVPVYERLVELRPDLSSARQQLQTATRLRSDGAQP